jgi:phosphotransferase system enzyme I (PtsI)
MEIKKGIAVSPGIAIAKSMIVDSEDYRIPRRSIKTSQRAAESQRVRDAFKGAIDELAQLDAPQQDIEKNKIMDIFAVHLRFLRDRSLRKKITDLICSELVTAEYAVSRTMREIASHFAKVKDAYISERAADIYDIERRLLKNLLGGRRENIAQAVRKGHCHRCRWPNQPYRDSCQVSRYPCGSCLGRPYRNCQRRRHDHC